MDINIQPKQSSMSASTVSAMITLTTEEIVVNTSTNAADDYTLSQYKEAQKELEEVIGSATGLQSALDGKSDIGHTHSLATTTTAGHMSGADKSKLDEIAPGDAPRMRLYWKAQGERSEADAYIAAWAGDDQANWYVGEIDAYTRQYSAVFDLSTTRTVTLSTLTAWGQEVRIWDMDWRVEA